MIQSLQSLCDELHLTASYVDEKQLSALKTWCHTHISEDRLFEGASEAQYSHYIALAKQYLDDFIPLVPNNLATPVAQFENLTAIQYAAKYGYHYFIETTHSPLPLVGEGSESFHFNNNLSIPPDAFNQANPYGMTPLHLSASLGFAHTVRALLAKGANPKVLNQRQQYPIRFALFIPIQDDASVVQQKKDIFNMLAAAAPETLKAQDVDGETVLHWIAETGVFCDLLEKTIKRLPELVFIKNLAFHYPIHTAILNGQTQVAQLLLNIVQVATLTDGRRRTPLHYAARYGNHEMVQLCIQATSDLNQLDSEGKTPLLIAAEMGNLDTVRCLITHHANAMATDSSGHTPLYYARQHNNSELEALLVNTANGKGLRP